MASLGAPGRFGSLVVTIEDDFLGERMDSSIVLVKIQSFALRSGDSAGADSRNDGGSKGSSGEAGHHTPHYPHHTFYIPALYITVHYELPHSFQYSCSLSLFRYSYSGFLKWMDHNGLYQNDLKHLSYSVIIDLL